ncbi:hypothetical protein ATO10_05567 [Actibacterium atlanticum]|uniref:Recombinase XerC n=1 Tax=Actibacterium atlanticum TaxID=1461693 RepID=A0A058ZNB2_9RHOB|nr:DUF484 family protein [Actibacterium atlanticum]KCV83053.1 hypothetical protein ATO10_05567 [Actibacterium atlanticum]
MSSTALTETKLRDKIIADPDVILEDADLMRALIAANDKSLGTNVIDLRGIAMERLEARLERLEDTHRSVIAAAYDNLAGTNQVHRAVLALMDAADFESFLKVLADEVTDILRVDSIRLVLETAQDDDNPAVRKLGDVLSVAEPGFIHSYLSQGRGSADRQVTLRQMQPQDEVVYGEAAGWIRSEALLKLDLGEGRLPGMLAMGAEDPNQFSPSQGTDLLSFFAGVFERSMQRWLS